MMHYPILPQPGVWQPEELLTPAQIHDRITQAVLHCAWLKCCATQAAKDYVRLEQEKERKD